MKEESSEPEKNHKEGFFLKIPKAMASHKRCVCCRKKFRIEEITKQSSKLIKKDSIIDCFIETGILIKDGCRACPSHFIENSEKLDETAFNMIRAIDSKVNLSKDEIESLVLNLRVRSKNKSIFENFKSPVLPSNKLCIGTCGLSKAQFIEMCGFLENMHTSDSRTKSQALAIYLFWLKTGATQDIIASYFGQDLTQQDISRYCDHVRKALSGEFIKQNIGPTSKSREEFIKHNSVFANEFYMEKDERRLGSFLLVMELTCTVKKVQTTNFGVDRIVFKKKRI